MYILHTHTTGSYIRLATPPPPPIEFEEQKRSSPTKLGHNTHNLVYIGIHLLIFGNIIAPPPLSKFLDTPPVTYTCYGIGAYMPKPLRYCLPNRNTSVYTCNASKIYNKIISSSSISD